MATPVFIAKGPVSSEFRTNRTVIDFTVPSTAGKNDLLLLCCQSSDEVIVPPSGWTEIGNQNVQSRSDIALTRLAVFYKFADFSDPGSTVTTDTNNDHTMGQILVFRGVDKLGFAATTNYSSVSGITSGSGTVQSPYILSINSTVKPTRSDCSILAIAAISRDFNSTDNFSTIAINPNLTSITELTDVTVNTGSGGGIVAWSGTNSGLSTVGMTTAVYSGSGNSQAYGGLIINLRPKRNLTSFS